MLDIWIDKNSRQELREELRDHDIYPAAFRHYLDMPETDDVDILAKVGFDLVRVPTRHDRVNRFWDQETCWLETDMGIVVPSGEIETPRPDIDPLRMAAEERATYDDAFKFRFWETSLDHYAIYGIDELEQAKTYSAPQFADQFGSFQSLTRSYGGPLKLKQDLEMVKQHLYVAMTV